MKYKLLIIGAGMSAAYLLQALAEHEHDLEIVVIGEEARPCYNRVLLSSLLAGECSETDLELLTDKSTLHSVTFINNTRIESVDTRHKSCTTSQGQVLAYDQLVFATGASVAAPGIYGHHAQAIGVFRTIEDSRALAATAESGSQAVVIGGGLLGLEAAHGLNELGYHTTVIHRQNYLMNRQLDRPAGELLQSRLESRGIEFVLSECPQGIVSEYGTLQSVRLESGETIPCDNLVFATGITPNTQLAKLAGLKCDRGVVINSYMQSSVEHVYALGECTELNGQCFGLVAPIRAQAVVLARKLLEISGTEFHFSKPSTQLKISGIDIYSTGDVSAGDEFLTLRDPGNGIYRSLRITGNTLVGAVLVGDKRGGSWYTDLINTKQNIEAIRGGLMFGREICEAMTNPRLMAA